MSHALLQAWKKTLHHYERKRAVVQAADGQAMTFNQLDARASDWIKAHAPEPARLIGRAVVFAAPNGIAWLEIFLGLLKAGAVVVPLDAAEPVAAQSQLAEALRAGFWWDGTKLVALAGAKRFRDPAVCLIKLTSGSTGRPRPLVFTAGQLLADARQVTSTMGITSRDLNYALIPFGHSYGLGNITIPLLQGIPMVCGTAPLPHAIETDFARWKPTVFPSVPSLWRALAASSVTLGCLRLGISAGAPLPPEVARDFAARFGRRLHSFYGSSETGGISYDRTGHAALNGGVGRAMADVTLTCLPGQRLRVSSAAVFSNGNRQRQGKLGAWIMADRVEMDSCGEVRLSGRRGKTAKIGGRRINLEEVAERIRRLPEVRDVWIGVSEGAEPQLGVAVATERTVAEMRAALHADTAVWKIPKKWAVLREFPLTSRGKINGSILARTVFSSAGR